MNKEIARKMEWPLPWGSSTYEPSIIVNSDKILLIYDAERILPTYDPSKVKIFGNTNADEFIAIVEFMGLIDFKFGWIGEEHICSHHYIQNLQPYQAFEVQNSQWLRNLEQIFSTEENVESQGWDQYHHFILGFHDSRFECIAKSYYIEAYSSNAEEVFDIAYDRVTGAEWWMKGSKSDFRCPSCRKYLGKHVYANFCMHCGTQLFSQ